MRAQYHVFKLRQLCHNYERHVWKKWWVYSLWKKQRVKNNARLLSSRHCSNNQHVMCSCRFSNLTARACLLFNRSVLVLLNSQIEVQLSSSWEKTSAIIVNPSQQSSDLRPNMGYNASVGTDLSHKSRILCTLWTVSVYYTRMPKIISTSLLTSHSTLINIL